MNKIFSKKFYAIFFLCFLQTLYSLPTSKNSFRFFLGQSILSPGSNSLYYASPSSYLFAYDNYSQKIKSVDIETRKYNEFLQINFEIGQMLFTPQNLAFVQNLTAGDEIFKWNYLSSFDLGKSLIKVTINGFQMRSFYPYYNQTTEDPLFYLVIFGPSDIQILDYDGKLVASVNNSQIQTNIKSLCTFPEKSFIVTGGTDGSLRLWNYTGNPSETLTNIHNFSQSHVASIDFLERVVNNKAFLSLDNTERQVKIWNIDNLNTSLSYNISFSDEILGLRSISDKTAVAYGNGFSLDYFNIETGKIIQKITFSNKTIKSVEILSLTPDTKQERVAILTSDGFTYVYVLSPTSGVVKTYELFKPLFPQINKINYAMTFKRRNVTDNTPISIMTVVSDTDNKTAYFINENTLKNVTSFTFPKEIRGLFQIMGRYLSIFQDMMLIWYGDSYSIYQIQADGSVKLYLNYNSPTNLTIEQLGVVYRVELYAYPYIAVIDKNNIITILNTTTNNDNITYFKEENGLKFFCGQNFLTNFAYALPNDTLKVKTIDKDTFQVSDSNLTSPISHLQMNACFSKDIVGGGYFMTSNEISTITWNDDGSILFDKNFTNITSLIIEGNPLYTAVNAIDNNVYQTVVGSGITSNYTVGYAPRKNGFMFQFINNFFYSYNEKELAYFIMDCPFGSTQSESLTGSCLPSCASSYISLDSLSCAKSCSYGTYPTPIIDKYNNITTQLCVNYNSSILNCVNGLVLGNSSRSCVKCDQNHLLLSTIPPFQKYNLCVYKKLDGRLAALNDNSDGTGIATWCNQFINNCHYCNWNTSHCDICEWTFFRKQDGYCTNCTNNTEFHNGSYNGTGFCYNCSVAMPFCYICNGNSTNCTQCFNNYYFDERVNLSCTDCSTARYAKIGENDGTGFCRNCSDVLDQCLDCTEFGDKCTLCFPFLYLDIDHTCTNCTASNKYKNGSDSGSGSCVYCNTSMPHCLDCYGNNSNCQLCMENYYFLANNSCDDCSQGKYFKNGSINGSGHCYDCFVSRPNCNLCNNDPNHCDLCFENFWFDENNTCSNCSQKSFPTMYKNGSDNGTGQCLYCKDAINNCIQCTNNATGCTRCEANYYIAHENLTCTQCLSNTTFQNSSADGFGICYSCNVAFDNCSVCNYGNSQCLSCDQDYYVSESYRCKAYSFTPEFSNSSIKNNSLSFSIVKNRRYVIFTNPCNYDRTRWSLDARVQTYWVSSMSYEFARSASLSDIKNVLSSINSNQTKANYSDPLWTFYGNTKTNKLVLTGRHNAHYYVKYYCVYGSTFSTDTVPGLLNFYLPENTGSNGRIFLNMATHIPKNSLEIGLQILACGLQYASKLNDTNQILTEDGKFCGIHIADGNALQYSANNTQNQRRLATPFAESDNGIGMTYIFSMKKDEMYVKDQSSTIMEQVLSTTNFFPLLSKNLAALAPDLSFPTPVSGTFVVSDGMEELNISYPTIEPKFSVISKTAGNIYFTVTGNDGILFLGIQKNKTSEKTDADLRDGSSELEYYSSKLVTRNLRITLSMMTLDPDLFYSFYYGSQNLFGTNTSEVNTYLFSLNSSKVPSNKTVAYVPSSEEDNSTLITAVVCSLVGLLAIVCFIIFYMRWRKIKREESENESEKNTNSPQKQEKYQEVQKRNSKKNMKSRDMFVPTIENLSYPSGKDVMKIEI